MPSIIIKIPFETRQKAQIAKEVLSVDPELKPNEVVRSITIDDEQQTSLVLEFNAINIRALRTSVNAILDHAALVSRTFDVFC